MPDLVLSLAINPYDRVLPLLTGEVKPAGITLEYDTAASRVLARVFYDQIKFQRYDVSEMSFSSYLINRAHGWPYVALPVFHNRGFRYTGIVVRKDAGIRQDYPGDLKGKRFSLPEYQMTMALWTRGILQHEFGVRPEDIEWVQTRSERHSHAGAGGTPMPAGVKLTIAEADERVLFERKAVDAALHPNIHGVDAISLFSDPKAEAARYYRKTGIYPPHHVTVVRESLLNSHPWAALSLMEAFQNAKSIASDRLQDQTLFAFREQYLHEERELLGADPFVYGVKANLAAIELAQTISVEQGLTRDRAPLQQIFAEEVLIAEESDIDKSGR